MYFELNELVLYYEGVPSFYLILGLSGGTQTYNKQSKLYIIIILIAKKT